ncbi:MAG: HD domain-containing protein [Deltaproteobacteria bacterium]|nr:MAG: HD domain-containing protein [Deltaproteobacteria bacterium]
MISKSANPFLATALRLQLISRYHTEDILRRQTVAEHSFNVGMIAWTTALWITWNKPTTETVYSWVEPYRVLVSALTHDLLEVFTGDLPYFAKVRKNFKACWTDMERDISNCLVAKLSEEVRSALSMAVGEVPSPWLVPTLALEKRIIKTADYLELISFSLDEAKRGNRLGARLADDGFDLVEQYADPVFRELGCPVEVMIREFRAERALYWPKEQLGNVWDGGHEI